jgi:hypothetical protein
MQPWDSWPTASLVLIGIFFVFQEPAAVTDTSLSLQMMSPNSISYKKNLERDELYKVFKSFMDFNSIASLLHDLRASTPPSYSRCVRGPWMRGSEEINEAG